MDTTPQIHPDTLASVPADQQSKLTAAFGLWWDKATAAMSAAEDAEDATCKKETELAEKMYEWYRTAEALPNFPRLPIWEELCKNVSVPTGSSENPEHFKFMCAAACALKDLNSAPINPRGFDSAMVDAAGT